jgi:hypothetical protein
MTIGNLNYCPYCGSKVIGFKAKINFCPFCGSNLEARQNKGKKKPTQCGVCHQHLKSNQNLITCSFCGIKFHSKCVTNWLLQYNACPLCQNSFIIPERVLKTRL